jgi:hypothetical protein
MRRTDIGVSVSVDTVSIKVAGRDVTRSAGASPYAPHALDRIRDNDPFWQQGMANYELLPWAPVIGREGLEGL